MQYNMKGLVVGTLAIASVGVATVSADAMPLQPLAPSASEAGISPVYFRYGYGFRRPFYGYGYRRFGYGYGFRRPFFGYGYGFRRPYYGYGFRRFRYGY